MERHRFEAHAEAGTVPVGARLAEAAALLMTHAAFVDPENQVATFDALARAQAGAALELPPGLAARRVPRALWDGFWDIADAPPTGAVDPVAFTVRVVALGQLYDDDLLARCEAALLRHDNVRALLAEPEVRMRTADLEGKPEGSLGATLLAMLRANGYDLEVIDADTVVLPGYPAQNRTNRRILQLHDVWHLVADYGFTGPGEVAISGFQLAQFGQNYSARFLAVVLTLMVRHVPPLADMMLALMLDGWRHGRQTPDLLGVPWHARLGEPIASLRADLGVRPFDSAVARLMEAMPQPA